jgi:hypothetical protein
VAGLSDSGQELNDSDIRRTLSWLVAKELSRRPDGNVFVPCGFCGHDVEHHVEDYHGLFPCRFPSHTELPRLCKCGHFRTLNPSG